MRAIQGAKRLKGVGEKAVPCLRYAYAHLFPSRFLVLAQWTGIIFGALPHVVCPLSRAVDDLVS